jgi:hypothetical protein
MTQTLPESFPRWRARLKYTNLPPRGWHFVAGILVALVVIVGFWVGKQPPTAAHTNSLGQLHLHAGSVVMPETPGWSHRIIRSVPRLASGSLTTLPAASKVSATLFRTVILADVARDESGYRLARVGVGNGIPIGDQEVVVTTSGPKPILETLTTLERLVLHAAEAKLAEATIEVQTPTFALLRTPACLLLNGVHKNVDLRYAILVDLKSGQIQVVTWSTLSGSSDPPTHVVALPDNCTFDCALDVSVSARIGPIPFAWSFAMQSLPQGRSVEVPPTLAHEIEAIQSGAGDPSQLERTLAELFNAQPTS